MKSIIFVKRRFINAFSFSTGLVLKRAKLLIAVLLMAGFSYGQGNMSQKSPREKLSAEELIQKSIEKMNEKLDLSQAQVSKIQTLMEKNHEEMKEEREVLRAKIQTHREKMKAKRDALNEQIKSSLNEDQKKVFEEMVTHRKDRIKKAIEKRREDRHPHRGRPAVDEKP